jgi:hypothetical protein
MGLGSLSAVSLADARAKTGEYRSLRQEGIDPIEARKGAARPSGARGGEGNHLSRSRGALHRHPPRRLEKRQARRTMGEHTRNLRILIRWASDRHDHENKPTAKTARAALD